MAQPGTVASKAPIFMWIGAICGVGALVWYLVTAQLAWSAQSWAVADGRVVESTIAAVAGKGRNYAPVVTYSFEAGGQTYTGRGIYVDGPRNYSSTDRAARDLRDYPTGAPVRVYYDPADPRRTALRLEADYTPIMISAGFGLFMFLVGFAIRLFAGGRRPK
jgi:hypothetical protein